VSQNGNGNPANKLVPSRRIWHFLKNANATRLHPNLPTFRHHSLFTLGVVFGCRLFRPSGEGLFVSAVERVGMFFVILDRVDS
jgi:hypothetical protein